MIKEKSEPQGLGAIVNSETPKLFQTKFTRSGVKRAKLSRAPTIIIIIIIGS